jgi:hypothetical protein
MNSANKRLSLKEQFTLPALVLAVLVLSISAGQATAPAVSPSEGESPLAAAPAAEPAPETVVAAEVKEGTDEAAQDSEKEPEKEEIATIPDAQAPDPQEVLAMLRSGNGGKPLTVTQLASINDMLKRMEFLSQVETKMRDITGGLSGGTTAPMPASNFSGGSAMPGGPRPGGQVAGASGGNLTVVRIVGVGGSFSATLTNGTGQMTVREGDNTDLGRVQRIGVNGVTVLGSGGLITLPFSSSAAFAGVSFNR